MGSIIALICVTVGAFFLIKRSIQHEKDLSREKLVQKQKSQQTKSTLELIKDAQVMAQKTQAFIQANIVGDRFVADAINGGTYTGPLPERRDDGGWLSIFDNLRILKIAGINYRSNIGKYVGRVECTLVPEPDNEYDPDAIKIVADDRHHLGYIPTGQTDFVRSLTANEFPYRCAAFIDEHKDEDDGHKFFTGFVYIKRLD